MNSCDIESVTNTIAYIEAHLQERLDLDRVATDIHYSKFHLHRMFTQATGITIHDYIRRRQLTEAARHLVFSEKPVLEIALSAGYGSQQAFAGIFKSMYKQTPGEYKRNRDFYPLQLAFGLNKSPRVCLGRPGEISYGALEDIPEWMAFVRQVLDGFPGFHEEEHRESIRSSVRDGRVLLMRDGEVLIGAAAFSCQAGAGSIDFLGVHPQYRHRGVAGALLDFMMEKEFAGDVGEVSITTFRQGDPADTGQRREYRELGFEEAELLTEFGYPTQRMVLQKSLEPRRTTVTGPMGTNTQSLAGKGAPGSSGRIVSDSRQKVIRKKAVGI